MRLTFFERLGMVLQSFGGFVMLLMLMSMAMVLATYFISENEDPCVKYGPEQVDFFWAVDRKDGLTPHVSMVTPCLMRASQVKKVAQ